MPPSPHRRTCDHQRARREASCTSARGNHG
jgi:hypothetical protein